MAATFILNTRAEFLKSKRTAALWLTVIGAVFVPLINFISLMARPDHYVQSLRENPWRKVINENWEAGSIFLLPMFVILVTSLIVQTEYKNNTWKQVYASPRSYADVFFSKLLVIHALILLCFLLFNTAIVLFSWTTMIFNSGYQYFKQPVPWALMFGLLAKAYFSVLSITMIQYWLSLRFRNFIAPMGIGLALLITGLIIHKWDKLYVYPYTYPAVLYISAFAKNPAFIQKTELYNMGWFIAVLGLSFWDTVKRKERG